MKELEVRLRFSEEVLVGQLAESDGKIYFEYDSTFLKENLQISPFKLFVSPGLKVHKDFDKLSIFGVFEDSLPDGWGLRLMDQYYSSRGMQPQSLSVLDRLGYIGDRTMGALCYHPSEKVQDETVDLRQLAEDSEDFFRGNQSEVLEHIRIAGGSAGGARPKVSVWIDSEGVYHTGEIENASSWIIKFAINEEFEDFARVEYCYSKMAASCGVEISETKLFTYADGKSCFGSARFDRLRLERFHMHTLGGLIHSNFRIPSCDYSTLLNVTQKLTRSQAEVQKAFRLMVFNVLAHNRDDHVKNFSFLMDQEGTWRLSPAYDLTPSIGPGGEHSLAVLGVGKNIRTESMIKVGVEASLDKKVCREIVEEVRDELSKFKKMAQDLGVRKNDIKKIQILMKTAVEYCE